jgi:hypothetical protein
MHAKPHSNARGIKSVAPLPCTCTSLNFLYLITNLKFIVAHHSLTAGATYGPLWIPVIGQV